MSASNYHFTPKTQTLIAPATILVANDGGILHNFSLPAASIDKDLKVGSAETIQLRLAPGAYPFFCKYHRSLGMSGTLTIVSG